MSNALLFLYCMFIILTILFMTDVACDILIRDNVEIKNDIDDDVAFELSKASLRSIIIITITTF